MENNEDILSILLSAIGNTTDKKTDDNGPKENNEENSFIDGIDLDMIMKLGDIMSQLNSNDKNTELLLAIKPYLRDDNKKKIDTAVNLFRLISLIPLLKDTGLFENMF